MEKKEYDEGRGGEEEEREALTQGAVLDYMGEASFYLVGSHCMPVGVSYKVSEREVMMITGEYTSNTGLQKHMCKYIHTHTK